ncbi:uncharacterized protein LOC127291538 [Leptopilina boulardi]|uniref:uncharacterized protein LOC127291538 n=1 Tax=Leptopilina boulardi TaxID=63433 RepID=UPI0021F51200|nr:uncharacterized protein LOC127291538 [Leptopilina boulardi]
MDIIRKCKLQRAWNEFLLENRSPLEVLLQFSYLSSEQCVQFLALYLSDNTIRENNEFQLINQDYANIYPFDQPEVSVNPQAMENEIINSESDNDVGEDSSDEELVGDVRNQGSMCCICRETASTNCFVPCGHLAICDTCKETYSEQPQQTCPMCWPLLYVFWQQETHIQVYNMYFGFQNSRLEE